MRGDVVKPNLREGVCCAPPHLASPARGEEHLCVGLTDGDPFIAFDEWATAQDDEAFSS